MATLIIIGGTGELGRKTVAAAEATDGTGWEGNIVATYKSSNPSKTSRVIWESLDVSDHQSVRSLLLSQESSQTSVLYCAIPKGGNASAKKNDKLRYGIVDDVIHCAEAVALMGGRFVAVSTDLVFDGNLNKDQCYDENSTTNPINAYGMYKSEMEKRLLSVSGSIVIARTSLILSMDKLNGDNEYNFGKGMKFVVDCVLGKHGEIELFTDELRNMSFADDLGKAMVELGQLSCNHVGLIHMVSDECTNRWELAKLIAKYLGHDHLIGKFAKSGLCSQTDMSNTRPLNCRLCTKTRCNVLKTHIRGITERLSDK